MQVQLLQAGVLTVNEVRAMRGLGPLAARQRRRTSAYPGNVDETTRTHGATSGRSRLEGRSGQFMLLGRAESDMRLEAMAVKIPHVEGHPNRVPFEGVLTVVNAASDKAPAGARGHRVMLTREAAENALPSLLGMAVDYRPGWDGHDARRKIGMLTEADLVGQHDWWSRGYLYARDFPEVAKAIAGACPAAMGMSYELADARVEDMRAEVWKLTRVTFTGAAILLREKAATAPPAFAWRVSAASTAAAAR